MWMNPIYHADAGFNPMSIHIRYAVDKVTMGKVRFFPCQHHSSSVPYSPSSTCYFYPTNKWKTPGKLQISKVLSDIGEH